MTILGKIIGHRVHIHDAGHFARGVSSEITIKYGITGNVNQTLTAKWNILGVVTQMLQLRYKIFDSANASVIIRDTTEGEQLPDIEELPPVIKRPIVVQTGFKMEARLTCPETCGIHMSSRLKAPFVGVIKAHSESLLKRVSTGTVRARLRAENHVKVKMESLLKSPQNVARLEARISLVPVYALVKRNLEMLLHKKSNWFILSEDIFTEPGDREKSFDEPSSFVGKVTYNPHEQTMEVILNGKVYNYCNVPERVFDGFAGADSKGAYFARHIRNQLEC